MNPIRTNIFWFTSDPEWIRKTLIMGLWNLIPIAGNMNTYGWMLACMQNLRAKNYTLPPTGFNYVGAGVPIFLWQLLFGVLVSLVLQVPAKILAGMNSQDQSGGNVIVALLIILLSLASIVYSLILTAVFPSAILHMEKHGNSGIVSLAPIERSLKNPTSTLWALLYNIAGQFISAVGVLLCIVGVIFTAPLIAPILAAAAVDFDLNSGNPDVFPPSGFPPVPGTPPPPSIPRE